MPSTPSRTAQLQTLSGLTLTCVAADEPRSRRALALLALIAAAGQNDVDPDRIVALLWPASDTDHAADSFRQILRTVRRELGDAALNTKRVASHPFRVDATADSAMGDWLAIN